MTFTIFVGRPCDSPFIIRKVYTPSIFVSIFGKNCSEKRWSLLTGTNPSFPGNTYPVRQWVIKAREKCKFGVTVCLKRQAKINVRILFYCIVFTFLFLNNEALLKKRFQNHDDFSLWSNKRKLQFHPQICKEITLFSTFSSFSRLMAALRAGDSFDIAQIVVGGKKELKSREFADCCCWQPPPFITYFKRRLLQTNFFSQKTNPISKSSWKSIIYVMAKVCRMLYVSWIL